MTLDTATIQKPEDSFEEQEAKRLTARERKAAITEQDRAILNIIQDHILINLNGIKGLISTILHGGVFLTGHFNIREFLLNHFPCHALELCLKFRIIAESPFIDIIVSDRLEGGIDEGGNILLGIQQGFLLGSGQVLAFSDAMGPEILVV